MSSRSPRLYALVSLACWLAYSAAPVRGDAIALKNGGEIRGEILTEFKESALPRELTIRSLSGAQVTVRSDEVDKVVRRRPVLEEYETRRRAAADSLEGQWELAEWCRQKSLSRERQTHLLRILDFDPEHVAAHRALGHVRHEGKWTSQDEIMVARGYVKFKGKYVLPQELELIHQQERETEAEKSWYKRVKMWYGWAASDRPERQAEGLGELSGIRTQEAVPALVRAFRKEPTEQGRLLFVAILTRIDGEKTLVPLVTQSLSDDLATVRDAAIAGVRRKDKAKASAIYVRALRNEVNVIVNRAGMALGQLGDDSVVPQLIEALVTRHKYRVLVPDQQQTGFRSDGSMVDNSQPVLPPEIAVRLLTGQLPQGIQYNEVQTPGVELRKKEVLIFKDEENPGVLAALNLLTGANFGYDEPAWRAWLNAQHQGTIKAKKKPKV